MLVPAGEALMPLSSFTPRMQAKHLDSQVVSLFSPYQPASARLLLSSAADSASSSLVHLRKESHTSSLFEFIWAGNRHQTS